jgi:hypothetical protein
MKVSLVMNVNSMEISLVCSVSGRPDDRAPIAIQISMIAAFDPGRLLNNLAKQYGPERSFICFSSVGSTMS